MHKVIIQHEFAVSDGKVNDFKKWLKTNLNEYIKTLPKGVELIGFFEIFEDSTGTGRALHGLQNWSALDALNRELVAGGRFANLCAEMNSYCTRSSVASILHAYIQQAGVGQQQATVEEHMSDKAAELFRSAQVGHPLWDTDRPQPGRVGATALVKGSTLDGGCGTGENALYFAARSHPVTGIDFLEEPVEFHDFPDDDRSRYARAGGLLDCFSDAEPGMRGLRWVPGRVGGGVR